MTGRLRKAGARWRLLVHGRGGTSHEVTSERVVPLDQVSSAAWHSDRGTTPDLPAGEPPVVLPNTEFDELVVGAWLHVEQKDTGRWWANIAGVTVWVHADRDGRATSVNVFGPGDYNDPVNGCTYDCVWSMPGTGGGGR